VASEHVDEPAPLLEDFVGYPKNALFEARVMDPTCTLNDIMLSLNKTMADIDYAGVQTRATTTIDSNTTGE
jgi:hypothetical protein